jgi:uncharacterized protein (DUF302 family)
MKGILAIFAAATLAGCATSSPQMSGAHGMTTLRSPHGVKATIDRFESVAKSRGLTVFARIDHAAGAQKIGKALRPTELLIFGNPQGGTPLMECAQTAGIDLPLKALAWQDAAGAVWLGYNEPGHLVHRHRGGECQPAVDNVAKVLGVLAAEAVKP